MKSYETRDARPHFLRSVVISGIGTGYMSEDGWVLLEANNINFEKPFESANFEVSNDVVF